MRFRKLQKAALLLSGVLLSAMPAAKAQMSDGGFPLSQDNKKAYQQKIDKVTLPQPNYKAIREANKERRANGIPGPYRTGVRVNSDINLHNSGTWTYLNDGSKIWRVAVVVPKAKGVAVYCDTFKLPKGVRLFVQNANEQQTLGAYTYRNNDPEFWRFDNVPVQGEEAILEMDIKSNVNINDIGFHLGGMYAFYRGVSNLEQYATTKGEVTPAKPTGLSASCNIDANCALPSYAYQSDYKIDKQASVQLGVRGDFAGSCSGTLINNTGNTSESCVPYVLTASHCDESNNHEDNGFDLWIIKYNYRHKTCDGSELENNYESRRGAYFRARSNFPSLGTASNHSLQLVQDFLLIELKVQPPSSVNAYFAGWNRGDDFMGYDALDNFFIGFHYPRADVEKKSSGRSVARDGRFNQSVVSNTHWHIIFSKGGTEPGSSGSGLFDRDGLLIGDLSGGQSAGCAADPQFTDFGTDGLYSKIGKGWENPYDQTNFPNYAGSKSQLKSWLDPTQSGDMKIQPMKADCNWVSGIEDVNKKLSDNIQVYPSPSNTGMVYAKVNLDKVKNLHVKVYNTLGRLVKSFNLQNAYQGQYSFDCTSLPNGIYLMQFVGKGGMTTKKVIINR